MKWFLLISALSVAAFTWLLWRRPLPEPSPLDLADEFGNVSTLPGFKAKSTLAGTLRPAARPASNATASAARALANPLHRLAPKTFYSLYLSRITGTHDYTAKGNEYAAKHSYNAFLNSTPVEQGGFVGPSNQRKTVYDVYGTTYSGGWRPPGWFGYTADGKLAVEFSESGSGAKAKGVLAIGAEENFLGHYPYADRPPNFAPTSTRPPHAAKPASTK